MEPNACPHCQMALTDEQVVRMYKRHLNSRRGVKSGGRNGGRPAKSTPIMPRPDMPNDPRSRPERANELPLVGKIGITFGANLATYDPEPRHDGISDRMAGLRNLLHKTEARVGVKGPRNQTPEESAERARCAALVGVEADASPTPYQKSENRRAWSEKMAKLRNLGAYDDSGAQEGFNELIRGHQLPQGFMRWSEARKLDWLVENVELPE